MKDYINANVMPIICEGLFATCKECESSEDPIDFLAEFLFTNYKKVDKPDPGVGSW